MANSKSNIYPIALQGAELCLNRYDAEIKQYRGFNKNNAPFVGGCLSNVFVKNEVIEGTNKDNFIITENEDIYKVINNGLYRNNEQILTYTNYVIEKEEIEAEENCIRVFSKDLKLYQVGNYLRVKVGNDFSEDNNIAYSVYPEKSAFNNCVCIFITANNKKYACIAGVGDWSIFSNNFRVRIMLVDLDTLEITANVTVYRNVTFASTLNINDYTVGLCYDEITTQLLFFTPVDIDNNQSGFVIFTINNDGTLTTIVTNWNFTLPGSWLSSGQKYVSSNLSHYHVQSYPFNALTLKSLPSSNVTDSNSFEVIGRMINPYYDTVAQGLKVRTINIFDFGQFVKIYREQEQNTGQQYNLNIGTVTPLIGVYDYQMIVEQAGSSTKYSACAHVYGTGRCYNGFNFYDEGLYNNVTIRFSKCRYVLGDCIKIGNSPFNLLFNNNQLSGISGQYSLFTDWNSIECKTLCFNNEGYNTSISNPDKSSIVYKEGSKWYVLTAYNLSASGSDNYKKIKIKNILNQIIANVDCIYNSYDIIRNKKLHFAYNYNSFYVSQGHNSIQPYAYSGLVNDYLIGCAINEYNQHDNSSIILNPINFCSAGYGRNGYRPLTVDSFCYKANLNIYTNYRNAAEVIYETSIPRLNTELLDLSYPIDTNGNVEYAPCLFSEIINSYGNQGFIKSGRTTYPLIEGNDNLPIFSFFLASGVDNFEDSFIVQGQYYGIINNMIYNVAYLNGVIAGINFVVSVSNLQYCGNTPYEALFYSATNRCLYSFTGANVLNVKQFVDKINVVRNYKYNPATQSIFLLTDIGVIVSSLFGIYCIDMPEATNIFLLNNGVVLSDDNGNYRYIRYYKEDTDEDYLKENIKLETCFYGMDNQTITINDCLYIRLFSAEHEEGSVKISSTTISLEGRRTEETTYNFSASDWDLETHTIYMRHQPCYQRGLGISFSIESPFKIASLSVGSKPDAILVDKVSKGAINAPYNNVSSNNSDIGF